jgi:curved DNA-binding protein CbpA
MMLTVSDPYRVLQVTPDAEPEVIQAAYRALARKHHPDVGGSELQMAMLNAAWETLRDEGERARYDMQRRNTIEASALASQSNPVNRTASPVPVPVPAPAPTAAATGGWPRATSARAPSGTVLDYGRYAGLSLGQIASQDRNYLEWLARTPLGRRLQAEIEAILTVGRPSATAVFATQPARAHSRFSRHH